MHISDMSRRLSIVYVLGILVFSFMESSILTIMYTFSFSLVFKLYKSSQQIIYIILDHLISLVSINIEGYLVVAYFERWILTGIHEKCESNHYLLLLAIFHDLEMI